MSTVETLHKVVDNMPEDSQIELLDYILTRYDQYVPLQTETEKQNQQHLLEQLLVKRFNQYKANPDMAVSAEESLRLTRQKYGW